MTGTVIAAPIVATFAGPAFTSAVVIVAVLAAALCWVISDTARTERLAMLISVSRDHRPRRQPPTLIPEQSSAAKLGTTRHAPVSRSTAGRQIETRTLRKSGRGPDPLQSKHSQPKCGVRHPGHEPDAEQPRAV